MAKASLILVFILSLTVGFPALGEIIFQDDFEGDAAGKSPAKWVGRPKEGTVVKDPLDRGQAMRCEETSPDAAIVADTEPLSEYVAEWDWMWQGNVNYHSMAVHWQEDGEFYHFSRAAGDGSKWEMWARSGGGWPGPFVTGTYPTDLHKWYRCQFTVNEAHIIFKIKERDDDTPFDELEPVVEMDGEDDMFKSGKFGNSEGWRVVFMDNVLIYVGELAVEREGGLTTTWGEIKSR